ncbi:XrtA-associated tyrosine autokinase [Geomonas sp. Red32]|uniref:XrtA-associated tyrosine autokinase n=1 Tax=Geomonas sp. Red32 TaxID=2912856 RepID=UPI00202CD806|nr:XrtA-associated tyrosine autokinase [Geomonas sp. Red32]MCM0083325.1 XrtA-associated tyrosine autokinase [Geomonas sp. Red32]
MSRIEIAMEKAARLREGKGAAPEAVIPGPPPEGPAEPGIQAGKLTPGNPLLVNLHAPFSDTAEEYRKLKLALVEISATDKAFHNMVLVTSSVPSEGKSLTAVNLAMSLAQELDHGVLLVDADLRKPALHRYLEIEQGVGLSDLLVEKAQLGEAVIDTGIGKLSVIRAGSHIDNPAELFSSAKMKALVEQLRRTFPDRFLIFDTPPVLPFAETRSLSRLVDGVLFVVMERLVSQANVREAMEALKGAHILGTVYNAALQASHDERYSRYHGYYKRAGHGKAATGASS